MSFEPNTSNTPLQSPSFGDRYELIKKVGTGGMGAVFMANDKLLGKVVAVKILLPGLSSEAIVRFQQEAKATAKLDHPNIVKVLDFGRMPSGDLYLVMDYINGRSLDERLKSEGVLPLDEALPVFIQICAGLSHAHSHGVLHRDIKPSNVMLSNDPNRVVQIVDFSIAKIQANDQKLTSTGARIGSPLYMSPEQAGGLEVDWRSDIYSLGCLMYKALTNEIPLTGETYMQTVLRHKEEDPPLLSENRHGLTFPKTIEDIVAKALARDREQRYQNADDLMSALRSLEEQRAIEKQQKSTEDQLTEAAGEPVVARSQRWMKRSFILVLCCSFAALVIAGLVLQVRERSRTNEATNSERIVKSGKELSDSIVRALDESVGGDKKYDRASRQRYFRKITTDASLKKLVAGDAAFRRALNDGSLEHGYIEGSMAQLEYVPDYHSYLWLDLLELWGDSSMSEVWNDRRVIRFMESPDLWEHWNDQAPPAVMKKYKENDHLCKLMKDARYTSLLPQPAFIKLCREPAFRSLIEDANQIKLRRMIAEHERKDLFKKAPAGQIDQAVKKDVQKFIDGAMPIDTSKEGAQSQNRH